jgi:hypothetical protein
LHQSPQVSQPPAQNVQGTPTGNPPTPNGGGGGKRNKRIRKWLY